MSTNSKQEGSVVVERKWWQRNVKGAEDFTEQDWYNLFDILSERLHEIEGKEVTFLRKILQIKRESREKEILEIKKLLASEENEDFFSRAKKLLNEDFVNKEKEERSFFNDGVVLARKHLLERRAFYREVLQLPEGVCVIPVRSKKYFKRILINGPVEEPFKDIAPLEKENDTYDRHSDENVTEKVTVETSDQNSEDGQKESAAGTILESLIAQIKVGRQSITPTHESSVCSPATDKSMEFEDHGDMENGELDGASAISSEKSPPLQYLIHEVLNEKIIDDISEYPKEKKQHELPELQYFQHPVPAHRVQQFRAPSHAHVHLGGFFNKSYKIEAMNHQSFFFPPYTHFGGQGPMRRHDGPTYGNQGMKHSRGKGGYPCKSNYK